MIPRSFKSTHRSRRIENAMRRVGEKALIKKKNKKGIECQLIDIKIDENDEIMYLVDLDMTGTELLVKMSDIIFK